MVVCTQNIFQKDYYTNTSIHQYTKLILAIENEEQDQYLNIQCSGEMDLIFTKTLIQFRLGGAKLGLSLFYQINESDFRDAKDRAKASLSLC